MAEVNEKEVQNTIGEEFEDFESMLEESLEKTSGGGVTKGIVVAIKVKTFLLMLIEKQKAF